MCVLVSVPEAYLLFNAYETMRPAMLVTDADGRRVTSIALKGADPAGVAKALTEALETEPVERIFLKEDEYANQDLAGLVLALGEIEGVKSVDEEYDGIAVTSRPGALPPKALFALIEKHKVKVTLTQPVAVVVGPKSPGADVRGALLSVPGVWFSTRGDQPKVWVNRFLLHPGRFDKVGLTSNTSAHRFRFTTFPVGSPAVPLLLAPFEQDNVLAVVPHVSLSALEVIVRGNTFDRKPLEKEYTNAGLHLRR